MQTILSEIPKQFLLDLAFLNYYIFLFLGILLPFLDIKRNFTKFNFLLSVAAVIWSNCLFNPINWVSILYLFSMIVGLVCLFFSEEQIYRAILKIVSWFVGDVSFITIEQVDVSVNKNIVYNHLAFMLFDFFVLYYLGYFSNY